MNEFYFRKQDTRYFEGVYLGHGIKVQNPQSLPTTWTQAVPQQPNGNTFGRNVVIPEGNAEFRRIGVPLSTNEYRPYGELTKNLWEI